MQNQVLGVYKFVLDNHKDQINCLPMQNTITIPGECGQHHSAEMHKLKSEYKNAQSPAYERHTTNIIKNNLPISSF